jgi:hypothetical protein
MDNQENLKKDQIIKLIAILWAVLSTFFVFFNDNAITHTKRIETSINDLDQKIDNYLFLIHDLDKRIVVLEAKH